MVETYGVKEAAVSVDFAIGSAIKKARMASFIGVILAGAFLPSSGESSPWDGTWRLNEAKSRLGGPTFTLTISSTGEFQIVTAYLNYRFYCDGKYRPVTDHQSLACIKATATTLDVVEKNNGKPMGSVHRELSPDGETLVQIATTAGKDGAEKTTRRTFARASKSKGLAGAWSDPQDLDRFPQVMEMSLAGSTLRLSFPGENQYTDTKLDGSDAPTHGVADGARVTLSVRAGGPQKLLTEQKLNGIAFIQGTLVLSPDGRSITQEMWKPDASRFKNRLVYEKQ